jgi:prolyl-tRNA synthetase
MAHSDNNGLVLPPKIAPIHVVIVPIYKNQEELDKIVSTCKDIKEKLEHFGHTVKFDDRDTHKPGWKFAEYELKGVPVRIAIGSRDIENKTVEIARRDTLQKETVALENAIEHVNKLLIDIQENIYKKALDFRTKNTFQINNYEDFKIAIEKGGFIKAFWDGTPETEAKIKEETKATIRCIPLENNEVEGKCMVTGKPTKNLVIFARAY